MGRFMRMRHSGFNLQQEGAVETAEVHNCSTCDYCYSNETLNGTYICVNGSSSLLGEPVDWLGLAGEDMECAVTGGKHYG